ncbi:MAG TPA: M23 family metallopeptidase [Candidatus Dojkabacteria bacterium]|nr:M23 family metallopeptidase [Candidatus Dojkabacteria bacterium]
MKSLKERLAPKIPFTPYLTYPIKRPIHITEGFIYSVEERALHGNYFHKGIDFATKYAEPVYAAASGYAIAGYHRFTLLNNDYSLKTFEGKPMGNGLGYFVQIYHPESISKVPGGRITQYGHLSRIDSKIKVKSLKPVKINIIERIVRVNDAKREHKLSTTQLGELIRQNEKLIKSYPWVQWYYGYNFQKEIKDKESYLYTPMELKMLLKQNDTYVTWVEKGDLIGYVGASAVFAGKPNYKEGITNPDIKEPENTWDEFHLHFEEAVRDPKTNVKRLQRDPFDLYKSAKWYSKKNIKRDLFID